MSRDENHQDVVWKVVVNDEEQYSVWRAQEENPAGWRDEGTSGSKAECLAHIESVWTDMRPLSLRRNEARSAAASQPTEPVRAHEGPTADGLVNRLCAGNHEVELNLQRGTPTETLRESLARDTVYLRFTETSGTILGIQIDRSKTDLTAADLDAGTGRVKLEGTLTLNDVPVRCLADVDLGTRLGKGRLVLQSTG